MNKYYFTFLVWLLPIYFIFHGGYQLLIYQGLQNTYSDGDSYVAEVIDFDVKQIAAQTNGYVVLEFTTSSDQVVNRKLGLPVQMAQVIMDSELIPVRYRADSFSPIVMLPTYELQRNVVRVNMAVSSFGLIVTILVSIWASRFALRRIREGDDSFEIEHVDKNEYSDE